MQAVFRTNFKLFLMWLFSSELFLFSRRIAQNAFRECYDGCFWPPTGMPHRVAQQPTVQLLFPTTVGTDTTAAATTTATAAAAIIATTTAGDTCTAGAVTGSATTTTAAAFTTTTAITNTVLTPIAAVLTVQHYRFSTPVVDMDDIVLYGGHSGFRRCFDIPRWSQQAHSEVHVHTDSRYDSTATYKFSSGVNYKVSLDR